jgi:N-acetylneuraminate lyase
MEVTRGSDLKVVVHVGANSLVDARRLAEQAQKLGALATAALAPSYFKPRDAAALAASMAEVAGGAPDLPFYYYEIPSMTGISISPSEFLAKAAGKIKNLAGLKFTSNNLMEYQLCRTASNGAYDCPFGYDEVLLAGLSLGATGAVGSTYNFAAPIYQRLWKAFHAGDLAAARAEQLRSVRMLTVLIPRGYMGAAKAVMGMLGVDVGPPRLPNTALTTEEQTKLRGELEALEFFDWVRA